MSSLTKIPRPDILTGRTIKLKPESVYPHAFYLTINEETLENSKTRFLEIFIESKNIETFLLCRTLSLTITALLRTGIDIDFLLEELSSIEDGAKGNFFYNCTYGKKWKSLTHLFAEVIRQTIHESKN